MSEPGGVDTDDSDPGPARSFEGIFMAEYPKMVALAAAVSGNRAGAEDIAQEAFSRLDRRWTEVSGYDRPGAWLRRVTINLAISRRRRLAREAKAMLRLQERFEPTLPPPPPADERLWTAVASLPQRQRAVVALHYLEDRPVQEIAAILDISPATARVHLHRARATLRSQLDQEAVR